MNPRCISSLVVAIGWTGLLGACGRDPDRIHDVPDEHGDKKTGWQATAVATLPEPVVALEAVDGHIFALTNVGSVWMLQPTAGMWTSTQIYTGTGVAIVMELHPRLVAAGPSWTDGLVFSAGDRIKFLTWSDASGTWSAEDVHPSPAWAVAIHDVDPDSPGPELLIGAEGDLLDTSVLYSYRRLDDGWSEPEVLFSAEVVTDIWFADTNPSHEGEEIWASTEMGQFYELPRTATQVPLRQWRVPLTEAAWVSLTSDIRDDVPGLELAYGARSDGSVYVASHDAVLTFEKLHTSDVVHRPASEVPHNIWSLAAGELVPDNASRELTSSDGIGNVFVAIEDRGTWTTTIVATDPQGRSINAVLVTNVDSTPGDEVVAAGHAGEITVIRP